MIIAGRNEKKRNVQKGPGHSSRPRLHSGSALRASERASEPEAAAQRTKGRESSESERKRDEPLGTMSGMKAASSAPAPARGLSRHGRALPLFTLGRALFSCEPALDFSAEEAEEALGVLRVLLALCVFGPAAAALSLLAPAAEGAWWPFLLALVAVNAVALAVARWRLALDDEALALPRVVLGEAGMPSTAALLLSWVAAYQVGLAMRGAAASAAAAAVAAR